MSVVIDTLCDLLGDEAVHEALSKPFKLFHCEHCMENIKPTIDAALDKCGPSLVALTCPRCGKMTCV